MELTALPTSSRLTLRPTRLLFACPGHVEAIDADDTSVRFVADRSTVLRAVRLLTWTRATLDTSHSSPNSRLIPKHRSRQSGNRKTRPSMPRACFHLTSLRQVQSVCPCNQYAYDGEHSGSLDILVL